MTDVSPYARDDAGAPPSLFPDYRSTVLRLPALPPIRAPQTLTETTGPGGGWERAQADEGVISADCADAIALAAGAFAIDPVRLTDAAALAGTLAIPLVRVLRTTLTGEADLKLTSGLMAVLRIQDFDLAGIEVNGAMIVVQRASAISQPLAEQRSDFAGALERREMAAGA